MKALKNNYGLTVTACCISYVTQAVVVNFTPLLFVYFSRQFNISLAEISVLIAVCFGTQLIVDAIASLCAKKIAYRAVAVFSQIIAIIGIGGFALFPLILPTPFAGLMVAEIFSGIGGGLMEVIVSPIIETCPTDNRTGRMSILHSCYCWGQAAVILFSTLFFHFFGIDNWHIMALIWLCIPVTSIIMFLFVPIVENDPTEPYDKAIPKKQGKQSVFKNKLFYLFVIIMICSGAAELSMSQWASAFAETALNIPKALGDIFGPCIFAVAMGIARVLYAALSSKINNTKCMIFSCCLCVASYIIASISALPILAFAGCALCGFSVGILWPGTLSLASKKLHGGLAMFALLALSGDIGCFIGPALTGTMAEVFGGSISISFLFSIIFPIIMIAALLIMLNSQNNRPRAKHAAKQSN